MAHHGVASPLGAVPVPAYACPASLVLAGVRAVCLWSRRVRCSGFVGARSCESPLGRCSALVPWRCSGRLRSRICCVQVFCLLRCWLVPVAWGRHGMFLLCAVSPPWGRKLMISGLTAVKTFIKFGALFPALPWQRCMHNPSSGTSRCSVAVLPVSPVPFICTPPRRWQGPVGPPWSVPVLPMGAPGCYSGSVLRCSCSCLSACRAPYRAVFCGSCGWRACVAVLSLAVRMVREVRLVLWCRDVLSSVEGWARRNTSVPAGRGSAWPRVASLWSLACPGWGFGG